ncbi:CDP-alcohol phosphatidyltransferase family protein [Desulfovibrio subterraneus]|uniref:CDP-alcohol phosphatidyltransferase family protein n=1 Tax=Desulfovibrio subterraneus TaxID=2718620 RepID=UPI0022B93CA7|nr:CDP-alcohol phosphatidyltransferase family protein [Desulfovibrio subterraneus]WBF66517.1 CDP-alcohol phosphatidyltransferase family protein [Desulfovibrio subterraneus]
MLYLQKGNFQKVVRWLGGSWMTANQATILGMVFVFLVALSLFLGLRFEACRWMLVFTPIFLVLRMAMNALDGMLAREYQTGSVAGELCNEALDVIGDTICYGVLLFVPQLPDMPVFIFIVLIWMAEYFGVLGKSLPGGVRRHETFFGGKPDRAIWIGAFALLCYLFPGFIEYGGIYISIVCCFVLMTSLVRIKKTLKVAEGKKYESYTWIGR